MAKRSKYVKPAEPHILRAQVVASKQVSPNFIRVTVGGDDLNRFVPMGHDQWFRMFVKRPGQTELRLPTQTSKLWYAQYLMMGKDTRPTVRNYTVREFRPTGSGLFGTGAGDGHRLRGARRLRAPRRRSPRTPRRVKNSRCWTRV